MFFACLISGNPADAIDQNEYLAFVTSQAAKEFARQSPSATSDNWSCQALSIRTTLGYKGKIEQLDTSITTYYYHGVNHDSTFVRAGEENYAADLDFFCPNVFADTYHFSLFPNDTGGSLAVGFETDTSISDLPCGLAILDRYDYTVQTLYLFYPRKEGFKRYSITFFLSSHHGRQLPDSIIEQVSKPGLFADDHFRTKTVISDYRWGNVPTDTTTDR
jgi:hypothetical protein